MHLATTGDPGIDLPIPEWEVLAGHSQVGHRLVDAPAVADVILLTQAHMCANPLTLAPLRETEAWRRYPEKTFVVDTSDRPWCAFLACTPACRRGVSSCPGNVLGGTRGSPRIAFSHSRDETPDLLFSFIGGRHHPRREAVLALRSDRAVVDDSTGFNPYLPPSASSDDRRAFYVATVSRSKFVLCPRGRGTGSYRLQEVMAAGRVPVIISDDWVAPEGPDWAAATVRWSEARVAELPGHLEEIEDRYPAMSAAAAGLYDEWFAESVSFDRIIEQLLLVPRLTPFPAHGIRDSWYGTIALHHGRDRLAVAKGRLERRIRSSR